jgi:hypothetical protein
VYEASSALRDMESPKGNGSIFRYDKINQSIYTTDVIKVEMWLAVHASRVR